MADAPVTLTRKQISALAKMERQDSNLVRIKDANTRFYQEECADIDLTPTPPERKAAIIMEDNLRPFLTVGSFVKVISNTKSGLTVLVDIDM